MPFQSQAQWRFAFARHPEWARRWAHETRGGYHALPARVGGFGAVAPADVVACQVLCHERKSGDYKKCQGYAAGDPARQTCFSLADDELQKCLAACGGGGGGVVVLGAAALALYLLLR